jgi:hypothetical protein
MRAMPRSPGGLLRFAALAGMLLACATIIAGCASPNIGEHLPTAAGGLPEGVPARPQTPSQYPSVNDMPPPRGTAVLTSEEQQKAEDDLIAARNRAASASGSAGKPAGGSRDP